MIARYVVYDVSGACVTLLFIAVTVSAASGDLMVAWEGSIFVPVVEIVSDPASQSIGAYWH